MNLPESLMLFLMMAINCFGMDSLMLTGNIIPCGLYDGLGFYEDFPSDRSCFADAVVSAGIEFIGHDIGTNGKTFARDRSEKSIWSNVLCLIFTNNLGEPDFDCYWRLSGFDYILWNGVII